MLQETMISFPPPKWLLYIYFQSMMFGERSIHHHPTNINLHWPWMAQQMPRHAPPPTPGLDISWWISSQRWFSYQGWQISNPRVCASRHTQPDTLCPSRHWDMQDESPAERILAWDVQRNRRLSQRMWSMSGVPEIPSRNNIPAQDPVMSLMGGLPSEPSGIARPPVIPVFPVKWQFSPVFFFWWKAPVNIPILPEAFLTFASKSSIGPSRAAHGPYTQSKYTQCWPTKCWLYVLTFLGLNEIEKKKNRYKP